MTLFGLIGYPLGHSFSRRYFTEKFEREQIHDCSYELFPIANIEELPALLHDHPSLKGINVTIPYKQSVIAYLDQQASNLPIAACNCIKINNGRLAGYNTDVIGFEKSLLQKLQAKHSHALILGTGGSSMAVRFVLEKLDIEYQLVSRRKDSPATLLYSELTETVMRKHLLIINTTPLGMYPNVETVPEIPYQYITADHYLFDLVYNPPVTGFLKYGAEKGALTQNGYDMLVIQAEESWKIWMSQTD